MIISFMYSQCTEKKTTDMHWIFTSLLLAPLHLSVYTEECTRLALIWLPLWTVAPFLEVFENSSDMFGIFSCIFLKKKLMCLVNTK